MINIRENLEDHKAMQAMATALDIADKHISFNKGGTSSITGKDDKPLQIIQRQDGEYIFYIQAASKHKCSFIRKKLTALGMKLIVQREHIAYLSMRRLPENEDEALLIRGYLGISKRKPKSADNFNISESDIP